MAIDTARSEIEYLKNVVAFTGYSVKSQDITPAAILLEIHKTYVPEEQERKELDTALLQRIAKTAGWEFTGANTEGNTISLRFSKQRTFGRMV